MKRIVLIRHGESQWNKENRFTGWADVDLSEKGIEEAKAAGRLLKENNFNFDLAYTSVLKRAIKTLDFILDEMGLLWIDVIKDWRLNERHYGSLQGLNNAETASKFGEEQVKIWRRGYNIAPPSLEKGDERLPINDNKYKTIDKRLLPTTESLKDTTARVVPFWEENIIPVLKADKNIIVAAHGNIIRALVKHLDNLSNSDIVELNIPTATPLIYEFDESINPINHFYLGDNEKIIAEISKVKAQWKK